jgi:hypothetical protein
MTWYVDEVEAVAAVPDAVAVAGRVAWGVPKRPGQAATVSALVAATKCLTRQDSHAIRWPAPSVTQRWFASRARMRGAWHRRECQAPCRPLSPSASDGDGVWLR